MISSGLLPFIISFTLRLFFPSLHHIPIIDPSRRNLKRLQIPLAPETKEKETREKDIP